MNIAKVLTSLLIAGIIAHGISQPAAAITIETFEGTVSLVCDQANVIKSMSNPSQGSVGGHLTIRCRKTNTGNGPAVTSRSTGFQSYSHSQDRNAKGFSELEWDGNNNPSYPITAQGLPSIDLVQDGGSGIRFNNLGFDCAGGATNVVMSITVYDARDASGNQSMYFDYQLPCWTTFDPSNPQHVKDVSYGYNGSYPLPDGIPMTFPFSEFKQTNSLLPASINSTGAINITITGNTADADLSFSAITTDGSCSNVPDANGIGCTPTPTPTATNTPTATPTQTPTPTSTPTITPTPQPTPTTDAAIVPTPSCTQVAPTAEMKKIGASLLNSAAYITDVIRSDINRASQTSSCKKHINTKQLTSLMLRKQRLINNEIQKNILRSISVCGDDCVKVSFIDEVKIVKTMLKQYGGLALSNARKVVTCSKNPRQPGSGLSTSQTTLGRINNTINKPISVTCKVCK